MSNRKDWRLDCSEVNWGETGSTRGTGRSGKTRFSRPLRSRRMKLTHLPTGIEVEGEVPEGRYSKKELRELRAKVYAELFPLLEAKVAKHLRIPGR